MTPNYVTELTDKNKIICFSEAQHYFIF